MKKVNKRFKDLLKHPEKYLFKYYEYIHEPDLIVCVTGLGEHGPNCTGCMVEAKCPGISTKGVTVSEGAGHGMFETRSDWCCLSEVYFRKLDSFNIDDETRLVREGE